MNNFENPNLETPKVNELSEEEDEKRQLAEKGYVEVAGRTGAIIRANSFAEAKQIDEELYQKKQEQSK